MNFEIFERLAEERLSSCGDLLLSKNKAYNDIHGDCLQSFKTAGCMLNQSPVHALQGMLVKHLVSLWDIIDDLGYDKKGPPSKEIISEKIGDTIAYFILLEALFEDCRAEIAEEDV